MRDGPTAKHRLIELRHRLTRVEAIDEGQEATCETQVASCVPGACGKDERAGVSATGFSSTGDQYAVRPLGKKERGENQLVDPIQNNTSRAKSQTSHA